jgi:uncharacterized protein
MSMLLKTIMCSFLFVFPLLIQVAVAVMKSFADVGGKEKAAIAASMAKSLHDSWGVGHKECNNGVLLLLSILDRQIYINTGKGSSSLLTDSAIESIIDKIKPMLREEK